MKKQIGLRIRELREIQGYTRDALAEKADITSKFLYEIEAGKKGFTAEKLCRIAKALSTSCDYIMFGEENGTRGNEKIICVLETIDAKQKSRIHEILSILTQLCNTF